VGGTPGFCSVQGKKRKGAEKLCLFKQGKEQRRRIWSQKQKKAKNYFTSIVGVDKGH